MFINEANILEVVIKHNKSGRYQKMHKPLAHLLSMEDLVQLVSAASPPLPSCPVTSSRTLPPSIFPFAAVKFDSQMSLMQEKLSLWSETIMNLALIYLCS